MAWGLPGTSPSLELALTVVLHAETSSENWKKTNNEKQWKRQTKKLYLPESNTDETRKTQKKTNKILHYDYAHSQQNLIVIVMWKDCTTQNILKILCQEAKCQGYKLGLQGQNLNA